MLVNFNFSLETWVKNVEVEADSMEEAIEKLKQLSFLELAEGSVSDFTLENIEGTIVRQDLKVQATDIEYDFDPEIIDISVIEYLKKFLPTELVVTLEGITDSDLDDLEDLVKDAVFDETNYEVKSLKFHLLEKQ
jgi:hypothetical protein